MNAKELALAISSCSDVNAAFGDKEHPCRKVATWQSKHLSLNLASVNGSIIHRPEAWTGDLTTAPIVFIASNPSFDPDEAFPDWSCQWTDEMIADFAMERFAASRQRPYGAVDGRDLKQTDRVYLKSGIRRPGRAVPYWREVRGRSAEILDKKTEEVSARSDYVMTELVHCKSHKEIGVGEALARCSAKWTDRLFALSPARLVVVMGKTPALRMLELFPDIPDTWGSWKEEKTGKVRGDWPTSKKKLHERVSNGTWTTEEQMRHTTEISVGGRTRALIWLPRPNSSQPRSLTGENATVSEEILQMWRSKLG